MRIPFWRGKIIPELWEDCLSWAQQIGFLARWIDRVEKKVDGGELDIDETEVTFEEEDNYNIQSGDTVSTLFGKIRHLINALKSVAFTGNYADLTGTPPNELPSGGESGNVLTKTGTEENDVAWLPPSGGSLPTGGVNGDVLTKTGSGSDAVAWEANLPQIQMTYDDKMVITTGKYLINREYEIELYDENDDYIGTYTLLFSGFDYNPVTKQMRFDVTNKSDSALDYNYGGFDFGYKKFKFIREWDDDEGEEGEYKTITLTGTGDVYEASLLDSAISGDLCFAVMDLSIHFDLQPEETKTYVIDVDGLNYMDTENTYDVSIVPTLPLNNNSVAYMYTSKNGHIYLETIPKAVPVGGTTGQFLKKNDNDPNGVSVWSDVKEVPTDGISTNYVLTGIGNGEYAWRPAQGGLPANGTKGEVVVKTEDGSVWEDPKNIAPIVGVYAEDPDFGGNLMVLSRMIDNPGLNIESVVKTGDTTYIINIYSPNVLYADGGYMINIPAHVFNPYDVPVFSGYPSELRNPKYFRTSDGMSGFFTAMYYPSNDIPANTVVAIPISVSDFTFYFDGFNYRRDEYEDILVKGNNVWPRVDTLYDSTGQNIKLVKIDRSSASLNAVRITNCVVDDANREITLTVQNDEASMLQLWGYFRVNGYGFSSFTTSDTDATVNLAYKDGSAAYVYIMRYIPANSSINLVITYDAGSVASMITDYVYNITDINVGT